MKNILFALFLCLFFDFSFGQTTLTEDANGNLNLSRIYTTTSAGQSFFIGHQYGSTYSYGTGIFRAVTDNTGSPGSNYFYEGVLGTLTTFTIRADGQGYFGGNITAGTNAPLTYSGYTSLTANNATYGGLVDFLQNGTRRASVYGDGAGLTLLANTGLPIHFFSNYTENMTLLSNGSLGINTTAPVGKLQVNGTFVVSGQAGNANIDPNGANGNISYMSNSGRLLVGWNRSSGDGEIDFVSNQGLGSKGGFAFYDYNNAGTQTELMRVRATGQVLIGVSDFYGSPVANGSNMLAVAGGIETDAITVKTQGTWPDYVFKPHYALQPLSEVKAYIDENHHLPEMPSEAEIAKNGQNLGEMNKLLLKKVEDLTLYLIEKDKELSIEQKINVEQEALLKQIKSQLTILSSKKH